MLNLWIGVFKVESKDVKDVNLKTSSANCSCTCGHVSQSVLKEFPKKECPRWTKVDKPLLVWNTNLLLFFTEP